MHSRWPCGSLQDLRGTSASGLEYSSPCPVNVEQCSHAMLYGLFTDVSIDVAGGGGLSAFLHRSHG